MYLLRFAFASVAVIVMMVTPFKLIINDQNKIVNIYRLKRNATIRVTTIKKKGQLLYGEVINKRVNDIKEKP